MSASGDFVFFRGARARSERPALQEFARTLRDALTDGREFECLITGDREMRSLNRNFLGLDYATDVLSFPAADSVRLGEIAISANRAAVQAREFGHSQLDEIRILMLHGVLHLIGMDHETDRGQMARAEARWRKKLNLPAGLIARVRL